MSRSRSIQHRRGRKKRGPIELDITPLLDILTVLMVFLVYSYGMPGSVSHVSKEVNVPISSSAKGHSFGVSVQVSKSQIWVDHTEVLHTDKIRPEKIFDKSGRKIIPLFNELVKLKDQVKRSHKLTPQAHPFSGVVHLIVDKSLKYSYLKKIMSTCALAGYKDYKFVVLANGN